MSESLTVDGSEHTAPAFAVHESVEPDVANPVAQIRIGENLETAADVILVDMGDDHRLVGLIGASLEAFTNRVPGTCGAAVDKNAVRVRAGAVFDHEGIAMTSRQHFDGQHESPNPPA